jgi:hypothetical protein
MTLYIARYAGTNDVLQQRKVLQTCVYGQNFLGDVAICKSNLGNGPAFLSWPFGHPLCS